MMLTHWMLYMLVVSAALAALAWAADHAFRLYGRATRWLWATSLGGALALPILAFLRAPVPRAAGVEVGSTLTLLPGPMTVPAGAPAQALPWRTWSDVLATHADDLLLAAWLLGTVLVAVYAVASYWQVRRLRRRWAEAEVDGLAVLVSEAEGPAVVGLRRPRIVLPAWVLAEPEARRRLIVAHEAEHVAAGDPRLLASACGALLLTPWNPVVWWQIRRLRLAAELDCDARVLRSGADVRGYAGLLLDVGERFGRAPLAAAFAEPRSVLGRRLAALTARQPARRALRAAGGAVLALAIVGIAGATPLPQRPPLGRLDAPPDDAAAHRMEHTVLVIDSAGNYTLGEFSGDGSSRGTDIPECVAARRTTAEGQAACDARLIELVRQSLAGHPEDRVLYLRISPARPYDDVVHAMSIGRRSGASMVASLTLPGEKAQEGLVPKVLAPKVRAPGAPPSAAPDSVVLEVLPGPLYRVNGHQVSKEQLTSYVQRLFASRAEKVMFVKADGRVLYRDVIAGIDAARAAGVKVIGYAVPGADVPPPPPPPASPPPAQPGQPAQGPSPPQAPGRAQAPGPVQAPSPAQAPGGMTKLPYPASEPYTQAPELVNRDAVRQALASNYPPTLKQAGVGGTVFVWALVDREGVVPDARVRVTSGQAQLDSAALKVTRMMRFNPARNDDRAVDAWIQLPIVFKTSDDKPGADKPGAAAVPPPGQERKVTADGLAQQPTFTPYTVAPELVNRNEIRQALIDAYPPLLKQAGIGGTIVAWALVDATGGVAKALVARSSERAELDSAALYVTRKMRFTPARNRAVAVPVWIKLPIVFRTAPDAAPKDSTAARS